MSVKAWFPTLIYSAPLGSKGEPGLRRRLLEECARIVANDDEGQAWSERNYLGGFTTYASLCRLHKTFSTFAELEKRIDRHVRAYAKRLDMDTKTKSLAMTECWINVMPKMCSHGLHIHPTATVSGTYYLQTPRGAAPLKFEDPRLARMMAALPKVAEPRLENRPYVEYPAQAGHLTLFESWLGHSVPAADFRGERVSVSFNYNWF